jgi:hypothetical protein
MWLLQHRGGSSYCWKIILIFRLCSPILRYSVLFCFVFFFFFGLGFLNSNLNPVGSIEPFLDWPNNCINYSNLFVVKKQHDSIQLAGNFLLLCLEEFAKFEGLGD